MSNTLLFDKVYLDPEGLMGYVSSYPYYDTMIFDVDGDGVVEVCSLEYGRTSGLFTFIFSAYDENGNEKYRTVINSQWYDDLSFKLCDDGVVRVQGVDQLGEVHLFDIVIKDGGDVWLIGEGGQIIGDLAFYTYPVS